MKRELGIAICGLACCLCQENVVCNGCGSNSCPDHDSCVNKKCSLAKELTHCYMCEENCLKGILRKIKPYTFTLFAKKYGEEKLLDCLERNEKMGFLDKTMMKMAAMMLEKKNDKSAQDIGMQNSIKESYDISNKSRIEPLIEYIKSL